ncbi:MAG: L,D-transpeptidase family protein [Blautia sp.]|jgi:hypothetical protein
MSNEEKRTVGTQMQNVPENPAGHENTENIDDSFEDKIEQAMAKIVSDTVGPQEQEAGVSRNAVPIQGVQPIPHGRPSGKKPKKVEKGRPVKRAAAKKAAPQKNQVQSAKSSSSKEQAKSGAKNQSNKSQARPMPKVGPGIKPMPKGGPNIKPMPKGSPGNSKGPGKAVVHQPVPPKSKGKKGIKAAAIIAAMVVVTAGCAYGAMSYYYSDKFFAGTVINGIDCSGLTIAQVEDKLADKVENYSIEVISRDLEPQKIQGADIGYEYVPDGSVGKAMDEQNPMAWVQGFFGGREVKASTHISYSKDKLEAQLNSLECAKPENQQAPENAYVAFKDTQFEIVPETGGRMLDSRAAFQVLKKAVGESAEAVNFDEENTYIPAAVRKDDPGLAATLESCNAYAKASITYTFGDQTVVLDGNTIKDWLTFDEKGQFVKDDVTFQQHVEEYVAQLAAEHDTVGKERNFHTTSGRDIIVSGGNYGWQINQSEEAAKLLEEIRTGQVVTREPVYAVTGYTYGESDIGDTYIEVDLSSQYMWYYQNGSVIFESSFVSGNMSYSDRATPTGVCHIYYKQRDQKLRGKKKPDGTYEYEQPVSYWMPFNGGVGFHDADWRWEFGGDIYLTNGSHGCINMPPSNAAVLYDLIDETVPIVVFY